MTHKDFVGKKGEDLAAEFLSGNSFEILERNFRIHKIGEVDIVAKKDSILHFVEVKTRKEESEKFFPEESVDFKKQRRFKNTISAYLSQEKLWKSQWQIDVITVILDPKQKNAKVKYIPNAFF